MESVFKKVAGLQAPLQVSDSLQAFELFLLKNIYRKVDLGPCKIAMVEIFIG